MRLICALFQKYGMRKALPFHAQHPIFGTLANSANPQGFHCLLIYWSKVLTDQQGLCRFFRKHKIVKNLKTATIKQVIIHLSNLLKCFFQKKSLCIFWSKNGKYPTQIRALNFTFSLFAYILVQSSDRSARIMSIFQET